MGGQRVLIGGMNAAFVEQMQTLHSSNPALVSEDWRRYFESMPVPVTDAAAASGSERRLPGLESSARPPLAGEEIRSRMEVLRSLKLLRGLPDDELQVVASVTREKRHADGEVVFREGDEGKDLFVVMEGTVLVRREGRIIAEIGVGDVVGEMAVLDDEPRSADAVAHGEVRLLKLGGEDLLALLGARPRLASGMLRMLSSRLRERGKRQDRVDQLIHAYRVRGHLLARLDPLGLPREDFSQLEIENYGLRESDLDTVFSSSTIQGTTVMTLREIVHHLRRTYCGSIGVQYMHIDALRPKRWLQQYLEEKLLHRHLSRDEQLRILRKLTDAEIFEQFIHKKFVGAKRFSLEGAESLIPLLDQLIDEAGAHEVEEVVVAMPHRGRLNVLANILRKSPRQIFREFDDVDAEELIGRGDVKYHLGYNHDQETSSGRSVHISLCFNPSHLEFVAPVAVGRVRAKQDRYEDRRHSRVMSVIIHGDAAFAGQGVVQEVFNLSELHGYRTGGSLHIIVNNQIGFTTPPESGRSTQYATDVARMLQIPIFHVNGEDPEAVAQVLRVAMDFRREFEKDVIIDMYCYRRHGHNEGDEPSYTQPLMYRAVREHCTVREGYLEHLLALGEVTQGEADQIAEERREALQDELDQARDPQSDRISNEWGGGLWRLYRGGADRDVEEVDTGVSRDLLADWLLAQAGVPEGFVLHPKLARLLETRTAMAKGEKELDWGSAEALAFASLLAEGTPIRLSGQDSGRGTFSHRHAVFHDYETGARHVPLEHLAVDEGRFVVLDSPLSEIGVLGFEYGYSLDTPEGLTIWEAQFGDFGNVAQVIIDQFIVSAEDKWSSLTGLVLLLPHGYEGQGPEHSSARLERFLALAAEDNIQVVHPTTPAQLFHLLRRQVLRRLRKPLVVMTPKSLLRHRRAVSSLDDLASGRFRRILPDTEVSPEETTRVLLCSGKVYYDLLAGREERKRRDVAILRLEQLYPLAWEELESSLAAYPEGCELLWVQEEPWNMGAWATLQQRFGARLGERFRFAGVSRPESASPATGSAAAHRLEQAEVVARAMGDRA